MERFVFTSSSAYGPLTTGNSKLIVVEILASHACLGKATMPAADPEVIPMRLRRGDAHGVVIQHLRPREPRQIHAERRRQVLRVHDDVVVELDVRRRNRLPVAPLGRGMILKV